MAIRCNRIRNSAGILIILSSRYQAVTLIILFPFILYLRQAKEKEHRRNHAHRRPARAPQDVKAKRCSFHIKVVRMNRSLVRKQHKISCGAPCRNKEHRAFQTLLIDKLAICDEAYEISVFLSFLAVISQPVIYYFCLSDSQ